MTEQNNITFEQFLGLKQYSIRTNREYLRYHKLFCAGGYQYTQDSISRFQSMYNNGITRAFLRNLLMYANIKDIEIVKPRGRKKDKIYTFLTEEQIKEMISSFPDKEKYSIWLMWETGLRLQELLNLTKHDIDLANLYVIGIGKGGKKFQLPISIKFATQMSSYLDNFADDDKPFGYPEVKRPEFKFWYNLKKLCKGIGIENVHPHMIRHALGHSLRVKGFDLEQIRFQLRHTQLETTKIYMSASAGELENKMRDEMFNEKGMK